MWKLIAGRPTKDRSRKRRWLFYGNTSGSETFTVAKLYLNYMRGARGLLLLAIVVILSWLGFACKIQRKVIDQQTPAKPNLLPSNLNGTKLDWNRSEYDAKDGRK